MLRATGCEPGRPIGLCMSPTVSRVASILGAMGIGSPYVPIDPGYPDSRIRSVLDSAGAGVVIVDELTAKRFAPMPYDLVEVSARSLDGPAGAAGAEGSAVIEPDVCDLAYIIYTSGSTGDSKGVAVEHGSVGHLLEALDEVLPRRRDQVDECWLAAANICFDMSIADLFWPLSRGIPLVVAGMESLAGRSDEGAEFLAGVLAGGKITHFQATPSLVQLMLQDPALAAAIRGLHVLIMGGEIVHPGLVAQLRLVPHIFNGYGPTEATVYTTMHECADDDVERVPIGTALRGVHLRVVDDAGNECASGTFGELLISGAGLARGYINDEELTGRKFPVLGEGESRQRWYRTGDLVAIDTESVVHYQGRADSQVKVRGFRIELGEIEAAIRAVPGVDEAVVLPIRSDSGAVTGLIAAVLSADAEVTEDVVTARLAEVLPWYALPHPVKMLSELPIGVTGKVDRKALERRFLRSMPEPPARPTGGSVPPRSPESLARIVTEVWTSVLGAERPLGTEEAFFDVGGNSALLGSVFTRLRDAFPHADLRLVDMYRYPTISGLSLRLGSGLPTGQEPPVATPEPVRQVEDRHAVLSAADRRRLARGAK